MNTVAQTAVEIDRVLRLNLNNREFDVLCVLLKRDPDGVNQMIKEGKAALLERIKAGV